jgi:hypothetical protein
VKKVSRGLGKKFSAGRLRRFRDSAARARAEGRPFGCPPDPETRVEIRICKLPSCGKSFPFIVRKGVMASRGLYHKHSCALRHTAMRRRKVPADYDLLYELYVVRNMSTVEIAEMFSTQHKAVTDRMVEVGLPRRKVGHSRNVVCDHEGCGKPVFKLKHPQNGSMYGTKCETHYWEHRKWLRVSYYNRIKEARGNIPERVYALIVSGLTTSDEIAKRLNLPIKVVSTTIGRLHRSGRVESFGTVVIRRAKASLWRVSFESQSREAA